MKSLGSKKEIMKGHAQAAIRKHEQLNLVYVSENEMKKFTTTAPKFLGLTEL